MINLLNPSQMFKWIEKFINFIDSIFFGRWRCGFWEKRYQIQAMQNLFYLTRTEWGRVGVTGQEL